MVHYRIKSACGMYLSCVLPHVGEVHLPPLLQTNMTDLFFPSTTPDAQEIRLILAVRYYHIPSARDDFFDVVPFGWEVQRKILPSITVPVYYQNHLRRFLWRHHLYMHLYDGAPVLQLAPNLLPLLTSYIQYMDAMAEALLTAAKRNVGDVSCRSYLFNMYLVIEFHIGRHEHDVVSRWASKHPNVVLECVNIDSIGKLCAVQIMLAY